jgi:hypothetical protein
MKFLYNVRMNIYAMINSKQLSQVLTDTAQWVVNRTGDEVL